VRAPDSGRPGGVLGLLDRLEDGLLTLILGLILLLAPLHVFRRSFFDASISLGHPLLRVLVLWVGMLGALAATRGRRQISIDILSHFGRGRGRSRRAREDARRAEAAPRLRCHPHQRMGANGAWQRISAPTLNLIPQFQLHTGASMLSDGRKRTYRIVLRSLRTLRFELIHLDGGIGETRPCSWSPRAV
jgi:hypothetical protein